MVNDKAEDPAGRIGLTGGASREPSRQADDLGVITLHEEGSGQEDARLWRQLASRIDDGGPHQGRVERGLEVPQIDTRPKILSNRPGLGVVVQEPHA